MMAHLGRAPILRSCSARICPDASLLLNYPIVLFVLYSLLLCTPKSIVRISMGYTVLRVTPGHQRAAIRRVDVSTASRGLRRSTEEGQGRQGLLHVARGELLQGLLRRRVPRLRRAPGPRVRGVGRRLREPPPLRQCPGGHARGPAAQKHPRNARESPTRVPREKTSSSSTIPSLNSDGSGRTESRFRVPTRAPRDGRSLGARLDDGKTPGFQCRPLLSA